MDNPDTSYGIGKPKGDDPIEPSELNQYNCRVDIHNPHEMMDYVREKETLIANLYAQLAVLQQMAGEPIPQVCTLTSTEPDFDLNKTYCGCEVELTKDNTPIICKDCVEDFYTSLDKLGIEHFELYQKIVDLKAERNALRRSNADMAKELESLT